MIRFFRQNKALTLAICGFIIWCGYAVSEYNKPAELTTLPNSAKFKKYTFQYLTSYENFILPIEAGSFLKFESNNTKTNILIKLASQNYTLEKEGYDTIKGVRCLAMRYKPIKRNFPWVQMWVNIKTNEIIAVKYWNSNKQLKIFIKLGIVSAHRAYRFRLPDQSLVSDMYLPDGYKLLSISTPSNDTCKLVFGDGLNIVYISIRKNINKNKFVYIAKWDYGLVAERYNKYFLCTIIADLPNEEISKIADSASKSNGIIQYMTDIPMQKGK